MGLIIILASWIAMSWGDAVVFLSGASSIEDIPEEEIERFEELSSHKLDINSCSSGALKETGLFNPFQIASLLAYRHEYGAISSFSELAMVDGIGEKMAGALQHFIILRPSSAGNKPRCGASFSSRAGVRTGSGDGLSTMSGLKARLSTDRISVSAGTRTTYSEGKESTACATLYSADGSGKLIIGDFNARFGQGLAVWSGMSMSGAGSPEAMVRNPSGISPSSAFSRSGRSRGIALQKAFGRLDISSFCSTGSGAANITYYGMNYQVATSVSKNNSGIVISSDFKACFNHLDLWGETAFLIKSTAPAIVFGASWSPEYGKKLAFCGRYYSPDFTNPSSGGLRSSTKTSDEAGFCAGIRLPWMTATSDNCVQPSSGKIRSKTVIVANPSFSFKGIAFTPSVKLTSRYISPNDPEWRNGLRSEIGAAIRDYTVHFRYETVWSRERSWLWYGEIGKATTESGRMKYGVTLRAGLFKIDRWDDRIYVYEKDLPGCFSIPAYYGRGWNCSMVTSIKAGRHHNHRLDLRVSYIAYPWTRPSKPSRCEARIQYSFDL